MDLFVRSTHSMQNILKLGGFGGMLPQGNFLKMNVQKAEFGNFSVTK